MKLLPINGISYNVTIPTSTKKCKTSMLKPEQGDTFTFTGKDLLKLSEREILNRVKESINYKYFLGQGTEAEVYRIKDSNYCVRIPYEARDLYLSDFTKNVTDMDKVNHVVAKLGFESTIMKYFEGETPKKYQSNNNERFKFQEKISKLPVKAYNILLKHIALGIDNEMKYDFSGGNLIVNFETKELIPIDFMEIKENSESIKPLSQMFSVLTCYGAKKNTELKIYKKIIDSALEEFKPNNIPCMDVELFDFESIYENILKKHSKHNLEKKMNKINGIIGELKELKKKEILDKSYSETLNDKISKTKQEIFAIC